MAVVMIDAMSSFECKASLRLAILNDLWFQDAGDMVTFLNEEFKDDESKSYHLIKNTADKRKLTRKEYPISGCQKMHMISVDQYGKWTTRTILDDADNELMTLHFNDNDDSDDYFEIDEIFPENSCNVNKLVINGDTMGVVAQTKFDFIDVNTYVALRAPPSSYEMFYFFNIRNKDVANEYI